MPQPRRRGDGRLSGYSDSRNWPSGLQPVATEPDTAEGLGWEKERGGEREEDEEREGKNNSNWQERKGSS